MNERIKQLAEQAGSTHKQSLGVYQFFPDELQEFAELIVRECMRMCEVTQMGFETHQCSVEASGAITVKQYIAEHFGVEE